LTAKVPASALQGVVTARFDLWISFHQAKVKPIAPSQDIYLPVDKQRILITNVLASALGQLELIGTVVKA
jgi:hypothetical protein